MITEEQRQKVLKALRDSYANLTAEHTTEKEFENIIEAMEIVKNLIIPIVGISLPKVCKGCGTLSTKVIDKKYLACCPDNNYIPMEDYCKNSIYPEKQF
jgi:hypothetical protein